MRTNRVYEQKKVYFVEVLCKERENFVGKKLLGEMADHREGKGRIGCVSGEADDGTKFVCDICDKRVLNAFLLAGNKCTEPMRI